MEDDEARDSAAVFPSPNPTRPHLSSPPFRATRRGFSVRGTGAVWWCLMASWIFWLGVGCARARLGEVWKTRRGGDLLRAGGLAGAGGLDCALRRGLPKLHTPQPQRTWTDASGGHGILFTWAVSRPGGSAGHRQAGATSRRAISAVARVGASRRWAPRRGLRPKRSSAPGFRLPSSLPTVVFRLAKYASSTRRAVVRKKKGILLAWLNMAVVRRAPLGWSRGSDGGV